MKSVGKLIRRFCLVFLAAAVLVIILNVILFLTLSYSYSQRENNGGWSRAREIAGAFARTDQGKYELSERGQELLKESRAWVILVEDHTGNVIWESDDIPENIPRHYTASELSWAVMGYIEDYPVLWASQGDNVLLLGCPKTSYWKMMQNTFDYKLIANVPKIFLAFLVCNLLFLTLVYMGAVSGVLRSVGPIVRGIRSLGEKEDVSVREKGLLSDMAVSINRTAEKLKSQEYALKKKETARANWIAGVSHDIRTPLSMVLGYASQLEEDKTLSKEVRKKAEIIRKQSQRMKNLINDLNLASKLEYNVQPLNSRRMNAAAMVRRIAVDFLNLDMETQYPIEWIAEDTAVSCMIWGDEGLLKRAVSNLIFNCQVHNPEGCTIQIGVSKVGERCCITVADNGVGVSEEKMESIKNAPHYMVCDTNTGEQRHGLGLLIVRQIIQAHHGEVEIAHSPEGGFQVKLYLPLLENEQEESP